MRVVFMGTPEFAVPSLLEVDRAHEVVAVYTRPDAVSSRGNEPSPSPVKAAGTARGIQVHETPSLRDPAVVDTIAAADPDVIVVAAFGALLPEEVLTIPPIGCINVHASLLPRWRGAAPIQRAILAGDEISGVSIMRMETGLDTGPVCARAEVVIGEMNAEELTRELSVTGARLLVEALAGLSAGTVVWVQQDETGVTYAQKISKSDVALSPDLTAVEFVRRVRASSPTAPARFALGGRNATVIEAAPGGEETLASGAVACTRASLVVGCADGPVSVLLVRPDGKRTMAAPDWARGMRLESEATWSSVT